MKKIIISFVMGAVLATAGSVYAEDIKSLIGKSVQDEVNVKVDGALLDKKAVVIDGLSYLPVRAIGDALDMNVSYSAKTGVELKPKVTKKVEQPQTEPTIDFPKTMTPEDIVNIKTSEEQIIISEKGILKYTEKIKELEVELKVAETKLSVAADQYEKQTAEMNVLSIKESIKGAKISLQSAKDDIPLQQAFIEKIKKKYEETKEEPIATETLKELKTMTPADAEYIKGIEKQIEIAQNRINEQLTNIREYELSLTSVEKSLSTAANQANSEAYTRNIIELKKLIALKKNLILVDQSVIDSSKETITKIKAKYE
ncbi:hypothetical protein [Cohnella sp. WQ 127256]|uniref:hypothetical protein n=1 Tax=Cohnella sp. WQ 127256 TaxID=2938790 RepID=UPI0021175D8A|nr:hypothetical protein [Cohnella sp. WQ 127256]